jgi:hypothetical protein
MLGLDTSEASEANTHVFIGLYGTADAVPFLATATNH